MTRVLWLIKGLGRGGAEQLLLNAAPFLDRREFEYHVAYLLPHKNLLVKSLEDAGVPAHCLDSTSGTGWVKRLKALVVDEKIDVVHTHSPYPAVAARLSLRGTRFIHTEHNMWNRYDVRTRWGNMLTFGRNEHIFAVSDHVRSSLVYPAGLRFLRMPKSETLYHGPSQDLLENQFGAEGVRSEFGIPPDAPLMVTVANFKPFKGHEYLIAAAQQVTTRYPDAHFLLVGQGPLEEQMKGVARDWELGDRMIFAGYREDSARIIAAADIFTLPSVYDGLSIALLEALALGRPVVITEAGGNVEVVDEGVQGLRVPCAHPDALATALIRVIGDDALRERMGRAAAASAARFDIRSAVARTEKIYAEVVA